MLGSGIRAITYWQYLADFTEPTCAKLCMLQVLHPVDRRNGVPWILHGTDHDPRCPVGDPVRDPAGGDSPRRISDHRLKPWDLL